MQPGGERVEFARLERCVPRAGFGKLSVDFERLAHVRRGGRRIALRADSAVRPLGLADGQVGFGELRFKRGIVPSIVAEDVERSLGVAHQLAPEGGPVWNQGELRGALDDDLADDFTERRRVFAGLPLLAQGDEHPAQGGQQEHERDRDGGNGIPKFAVSLRRRYRVDGGPASTGSPAR